MALVCCQEAGWKLFPFKQVVKETPIINFGVILLLIQLGCLKKEDDEKKVNS